MKLVIPCAIALIALAGCRNPSASRDVTTDRDFHVGYVPGDVYRLKADLSLIDSRSDDGKSSFIYADPRDSLYVSKAKAGTCFIAPRERFAASAVSELPAGTVLEVSRLRYETYVSLSDVERYVVAFGRLRDPPHADVEVALTYVSDLVEVPGATLASRAQCPNPELIERIAR